MDHKVIHYPEYWAGKKLSYPNVPAEAGKLSRSVVVGNLIFISGCQGANDETARVETMLFEEQMEIALGKTRRALGEAGSSMNNLVKNLIMLKDLKDYPAMRRTELAYYQKYAPFLVENPPVSSVLGVQLGKPEYPVEIESSGVMSRE
jgi:enamine deaminase RidA (YjgF/YER057c/UK114 family)